MDLVNREGLFNSVFGSSGPFAWVLMELADGKGEKKQGTAWCVSQQGDSERKKGGGERETRERGMGHI